MVLTSIEKLADSIGFDIGMSNDQVQADLLNGFCRGIHDSMGNHKMDGQICYITQKLTPTTENVLISIVEFIKLRKE